MTILEGALIAQSQVASAEKQMLMPATEETVKAQLSVIEGGSEQERLEDTITDNSHSGQQRTDYHPQVQGNKTSQQHEQQPRNRQKQEVENKKQQIEIKPLEQVELVKQEEDQLKEKLQNEQEQVKSQQKQQVQDHQKQTEESKQTQQEDLEDKELGKHQSQKEQTNQLLTQDQHQPAEQTIPKVPAATSNQQQQLDKTEERHIIWRGVLEWTQVPGQPQKEARRMHFDVSTSNKDDEADLEGDAWPKKLFLHFLPKRQIGYTGNSFFVNSQTIGFHPHNNEDLEELKKALSCEYGGCVRFARVPSESPCSVKIIMLLYSTSDDTFIGYVPKEQKAFMNRLYDALKNPEKYEQEISRRKLMQQQVIKYQTTNQAFALIIQLMGAAGYSENNFPGTLDQGVQKVPCKSEEKGVEQRKRKHEEIEEENHPDTTIACPRYYPNEWKEKYLKMAKLDCHSIFGEYVANQLRKMENETCSAPLAEAKQKIIEVLKELEGKKYLHTNNNQIKPLKSILKE